MSQRVAAADSIEDPIKYFLDDVTLHGKTDRTRAYYERVLRDFERFNDQRDGGEISAVSHRECMAYVHQLRGDLQESTIATYASYLHRFYAYMTEVGVFDSNPMGLVMEEMDESINTDPTRRELSVAQMRAFMSDVTHPLERAVVLTLLKTGVRAGELCNLDRRDVHLPGNRQDDGPIRAEIADRPGSLFVPAAPSLGERYNGVKRTASNKRKRDTTIPIDEELAVSLRHWLAIRPDDHSDARPMFVSTSGSWGRRLTPDMVHHIVEAHARDFGWYQDGGGASQNVTPHYFRHFFTTHMRDRTGDRGIVKYLRGDVAQDVIDTYTHDWGNRVRQEYLENVYHLL